MFLAERSVLKPQGGRLTLLDWRSHRIRRVCRSTLAAESMSMEAGLDAAVQIRTILAEAPMPDYVAGRSGTLQPDFLPIKGVTDCKSLYDLLCKEGAPSTTMERRLAIDVAAISEIGEEFDPENPGEAFKWVPTYVQWADHFTKAKNPAELREILTAGFLALRSSEPAPP